MADALLILLIQLALILVATRAAAFVAIKLRLAPVLGELAAGLVLGPTAFGALAPRWQATLFPPAGTINAEILRRSPGWASSF